MAANVKNYGYVLSAEGSKKVSEIKPVTRQFLDECKATAKKYPKRTNRANTK